MMAGVYSLGALADLLGRRRGFFASAALLGGAGLGSAFMPSYGVSALLVGLIGRSAVVVGGQQRVAAALVAGPRGP